MKKSTFDPQSPEGQDRVDFSNVDILSLEPIYKTVNGAYNYQGYKSISANYYRSCKFGAKKRGFEFNISKEDMWEQWLVQDGKCALSGIELHIERNYQKLKGMTASLDRIDSTRGYTVDILMLGSCPLILVRKLGLMRLSRIISIIVRC